jgi:predicted metalloprotease with PDZ domain
VIKKRGNRVPDITCGRVTLRTCGLLALAPRPFSSRSCLVYHLVKSSELHLHIILIDRQRGANGEIGLRFARNQVNTPYTIVSAAAGSPAAQAGLKAGNQILAIDGVDIKPLSASQVTVFSKLCCKFRSVLRDAE